VKSYFYLKIFEYGYFKMLENVKSKNSNALNQLLKGGQIKNE